MGCWRTLLCNMALPKSNTQEFGEPCHCDKAALKAELDAFFPQPLPDLVFAQILRGFLISNRKDKTTESVTYQNIYRILHEMNMTTI